MVPRILVVDDDPVIQEYVRLHLTTADFDVVVAGDVTTALAEVAERQPDLILSDISMPNVNGFDFLTQLRASPGTANIPFIFLTQHNEVDAMRRGMQLGANDFLTKPIRRTELLSAISGRLKILEGLRRATTTDSVPTIGMPTVQRAVDEATAARAASTLRAANAIADNQGEETHLRNVFAARVQDANLQETVASAGSQRTVDGSVLFSDIRNFASIAEKLSAGEVTELLNAFFAVACEPILAQRGWVVKFIGDGIIAMFDCENTPSSHQSRALKAGLLMTVAASQFQAWINQRFGNRGLPKFAIGVGIHCGDVSVAKMETLANEETTILGDTVNLASRLEAVTKELGWSIAASAEVVLAAGERFVLSRSGQIGVKGREAMVDIFEVATLLPRDGDATANPALYDRITSAVRGNTDVIEAMLAAKTGTQEHQSKSMMTTGGAAIRLDGYRLLKKLGEGGMSQVFLSENIATGEQQVLKLIRMDSQGGENGQGAQDVQSVQEAEETLQQFISEYALISQIHHPNVARIYQQGFSDAHAYIAMEYFPGGDLRQFMSGGAGEMIAVAALLQIAGALTAIHSHGIVHCDMKPDNIMIRGDGSLALADFGIATQLGTKLRATSIGHVYGTPSYLSPEQASDQEVDHRADIYALGVMFFELLTGKKPYRAPSLDALLQQHLHGAIPELPEAHKHYQPLIDRMMAKEPQNRFANGDAVIDAALSISPPNL